MMIGFFEITPKAEGRIAIRKEKKTKPKVNARVYYETAHNAIYKICLQERNDGKEYELFMNKYSCFNRRLLKPKNWDCPDFIKKMLYNSDRYKLNLLCNSACDLLAGSVKNPYNSFIAVIDRSGIFCKFIERITPFVNRIDIITDRIELYFRVADELYYKNGAAITVNNRISDSTVIADAVIIADMNREDKIYGKRIIARSDIDVDNALCPARVCPGNDIIVPQNCDSIDFAGALAEVNGLKRMLDLKANAYRCSNRIISRSSAVELLTIR